MYKEECDCEYKADETSKEVMIIFTRGQFSGMTLRGQFFPQIYDLAGYHYSETRGIHIAIRLMDTRYIENVIVKLTKEFGVEALRSIHVKALQAELSKRYQT